MRVVVQRVARAQVEVAGTVVGKIASGLLAFVAAGPQDTAADVEYIADKLVHLRIFEDDQGKMNRSVREQSGAILAVSQFTLYGDCRKGRRPSFVGAMAPEPAQALFDHLVDRLRELGMTVATGIFGAHMAVSLRNDGPVTLLIDSQKFF